MAAASIELPTLLRPVAGWTRIDVSGATVAEALEVAFERSPALRHHLVAPDGALRPHILCIVNDAVMPRGEAMSTALDEGDEILIHQAISGG